MGGKLAAFEIIGTIGIAGNISSIVKTHISGSRLTSAIGLIHQIGISRHTLSSRDSAEIAP